jgi:hypothetical protein
MQCVVEVAVVAVSRELQGLERVQTEVVREDISLAVVVLSSLETMQRQTLEAVVVVQPLTQVQMVVQAVRVFFQLSFQQHRRWQLRRHQLFLFLPTQPCYPGLLELWLRHTTGHFIAVRPTATTAQCFQMQT